MARPLFGLVLVREPLFHISCPTCDARLKVLNEEAIGAILTCPKCESMVQVEAPPGWKPPPKKGPAEDSSPKPKPAKPAAGEKKPADAAKAGATAIAGSAAGAAVPPPLPAAVGVPEASGASETASEAVASAPAAAPWMPIWAIYSGLGVLIVALAATLVGVVAWNRGSVRPAAPVVAQPGAVSVKPASPKPRPATTAPRFSARWVPGKTRLFFTGDVASLTADGGFNETLYAQDPAWGSSVGRVLKAFALSPKYVRRVSWAATDLADWTESSVVILELAEGQNGEVYRVVGEDAGLQVAGVACRRQPKTAWTHPFAVLNKSTIVTGRQDLLAELAAAGPAKFESPAVERFLKGLPPDAISACVLDLPAARQAGWPLPTWWLDAWPPGREGWHAVCETPNGVGLTVSGGEPGATELTLWCKDQPDAEKVYTAVNELLPAGKAAIESARQSMPEKLQSGRLNADSAAGYETFLKAALAAIQSARCETVADTVYLRLDGGAASVALAASGVGSRGAVRSDWLANASAADRARHAELLKGLAGYHKAEQHLPDGAGGASLLPPETRLSWIAMMLPYYGHVDWHKQLEPGYSWNSAKNRPVTSRPLEAVTNPALGPSTTQAGFPVTHYVGVAGVGADAAGLKPGDPRAGVFGFGRTTRLDDIPDGASNTVAVMGVSGRLGPWSAGGDATVRPLTQRPYVNGPDGFGSGQPDGMFVGMADGSVRFVAKDIDPVVLEQLATAGGRETTTVASLDRPARPSPSVPMPPAPGPPAPPPEPDKPAPAEPPADLPPVDTEAVLAQRIVGVDFAGVRLIDAVRTIEQLAGVRVTLDLETLQRKGLSPRSPVQVRSGAATVGEVLDALVADRGLSCLVENGQVLLSVPQAERQALVEVRHEVADLEGAARDGVNVLAGLIRSMVAPESWQTAGGRGTIAPDNGALKVAATEAVQDQVLVFCERLRAVRGKPPRSKLDPARIAVATRFSRAHAKLSQPISSNFYAPAPLEQVLVDLERTSGMTITVNWLALAAEGIGPPLECTLNADKEPLATVLGKLLQPLGVAWRLADADTIEITTPGEAARADRA